MKEKLQNTPEQEVRGYEHGEKSRREHDEQRERLRNEAETRAEQSREKRPSAEVERSKAEDLAETLNNNEKYTKPHQPENAPREREKPSSQKERKQAFEATMDDVRSQMSSPQRSFSKVIHNPVIEKTSDVVGGTVARPNAVLGGSLTAFIVVLAVYLISQHYGYPLSGSETILAFAAGWVIGIVLDYLRVMVTGKK